MIEYTIKDEYKEIMLTETTSVDSGNSTTVTTVSNIAFEPGDDTSEAPQEVKDLVSANWTDKVIQDFANKPPLQRQKIVAKDVEKDVVRKEVVLEDGKYVQKETTDTVTHTIYERQWEEVPLYGEDGEQLMRLVSEAVEAVEGVEAVEAVEEELWAEDDDLPEDVEIGDVKVEAVEGVEAVEAVEAQDAVYEGITHRIPLMEDIPASEE